MSKIRSIPGQISSRLSAGDRSFGVVAARFNRRIVNGLIEGAVECLESHGAGKESIEIVWVPGAWEIPLALEVMAGRQRRSAYVALGALIRGETAHFDIIASECAAGVARVSQHHRVAIGFGVLTCENSEQAQERAGGKLGNKGWEAALAALEMAELLERLG